MSYEISAVVGLVEVPTRDGRVLAAPPDGVVPTRALPLPLLAGRLGPARGDAWGPPQLGLGRVDEVAVEGERLVARVVLESDERGRDYLGALRLGAAAIVLEMDEVREEVPAAGGGGAGSVRFGGWLVIAATVVREPAWDLPPVEVVRRLRAG